MYSKKSEKSKSQKSLYEFVSEIIEVNNQKKMMRKMFINEY